MRRSVGWRGQRGQGLIGQGSEGLTAHAPPSQVIPTGLCTPRTPRQPTSESIRQDISPRQQAAVEEMSQVKAAQAESDPPNSPPMAWQASARATRHESSGMQQAPRPAGQVAGVQAVPSKLGRPRSVSHLDCGITAHKSSPKQQAISAGTHSCAVQAEPFPKYEPPLARQERASRISHVLEAGMQQAPG